MGPGRLGRLRHGWLALVPLLGYFVWYAGAVLWSVVRAPLWAENVFTQGRLFWVYARMLVWPSGLCADHLVPFSGVGLADPFAFAGTLLLGVMVTALLIGLWSARSRGMCFLVLAGVLPFVLRCVYLNKELLVEYRAYICSEHFYALALTETEGSQKPLEHTGEMLRLLESSIPGVLDPKAEYFEIAQQMVELDGILRHHGQEYDQGREQRQRERSLSQASQ